MQALVTPLGNRLRLEPDGSFPAIECDVATVTGTVPALDALIVAGVPATLDLPDWLLQRAGDNPATVVCVAPQVDPLARLPEEPYWRWYRRRHRAHGLCDYCPLPLYRAQRCRKHYDHKARAEREATRLKRLHLTRYDGPPRTSGSGAYVVTPTLTPRYPRKRRTPLPTHARKLKRFTDAAATGMSMREIADKCHMEVRTVERKLRSLGLQKVWQAAMVERVTASAHCNTIRNAVDQGESLLSMSRSTKLPKQCIEAWLMHVGLLDHWREIKRERWESR
jgi:hypothetical protein